MVLIPNTAFVNAICGRRDGTLFDSDCPFRTPDAAYAAWTCHLKTDDCKKQNRECGEPTLAIVFQSGGYFLLEYANYTRVVFIRPIGSKMDVALVIEIAANSVSTTFSNVIFDGIKLIVDYLAPNPSAPVILDCLVIFRNESTVLVTDQQSDITCPVIGCRSDYSHGTPQYRQTPNLNGGFASPMAANVGMLPQLALASPNMAETYGSRPPDCHMVPTTLPLPGTVLSTAFIVNPGANVDMYQAKIIANISAQSGILIFKVNRGLFRGAPWRINGIAVVMVKNIGGSVMLEQQIGAYTLTETGVPQFNVSDPVRSSLVESDNTNITSSIFKLQVGILGGVIGSILQPPFPPPFSSGRHDDLPNLYLFKLICGTGLTATMADLTGLMTFHDSVFYGNSNRLFNVYLTNTTLYTAFFTAIYNIKLYGIATNPVGPLFVVENGNSPIWNGSTSLLPVLINCNYTHTRNDGTIFHVDACGKKQLTITLGCDLADSGRIFKYKRTDSESCAHVLLVTEHGGFDSLHCKVIELNPLDAIEIQYRCGIYWINSRYNPKQSDCDKCDHHDSKGDHHDSHDSKDDYHRSYDHEREVETYDHGRKKDTITNSNGQVMYRIDKKR